MTDREWMRWDEDQVAETIEAYWQGSPREIAHRDTLSALVARFVAGPPPRVLEVGCGTGLIYRRLVPWLIPNERYVGLDVSARMLAIGRRAHPDGRFLRGDGRRLPFPDRSFDLVLCFEVLGHLPEMGPVLGEVGRVTRGTGIFTVWPSEDGNVADVSETICGQRFLHRKYPDADVTAAIHAIDPELSASLRIAVLSADCWAYILQRDPPASVHASPRVFPFPGFVDRLIRQLADRRREAPVAVEPASPPSPAA